jgi:hypothetical protein
MLIPTFPKFRKHRGRVKRARLQAPPVAFALASAVYDSEESTITLGFTRAIDVSAIFAATINVNDAVTTGLTYECSGAPTLVDPQTVRLNLVDIGPSEGPGVTLSATGANGIKALDDGTPWAGVTDLGLPFP